MKMSFFLLVLLALPVGGAAFAQMDGNAAVPRVITTNGLIEGTLDSGIRAFRGIPFARPPVGDLRWQPPQPVENWEGARKADAFGPRPMQLPIFGDMNFRSDGMSEDCLYLNVWTPAVTGDERLPVLVYFYGGGLFAGDGSEPRYDGESMAREGIVSLTVNYRLGVFGFMAHPELTAESSHGASGNYGFLDQWAALEWVKANIAAFGGDPDRVTIAGESAGSASVNGLMASPLSKDLVAGAIGSSASLMGTLSPAPLEEAEQKGAAFAEAKGDGSLASLRALSADALLEATTGMNPGHFSPVIDGYFLPKPVVEIYAAGEQAHVPLLLGWNSQEMPHQMLLQGNEPTLENYERVMQTVFADEAEVAMRLYAAGDEAEVVKVLTDLASDQFTGFSTWKWADVHGRTGSAPVYRYFYERPRPAMRPEMGHAVAGLAGGVVQQDDDEAAPMPPPATGAVHSAEIEYAMGNLPTNRVYDWTPEDYQVSKIFQTYYANFVKTGDPNGPGVPEWPALNAGEAPYVMHIDVHTRAEPEQHRDRYLFLDQR